MTKLIIFDFDGVLLDSLEQLYEINRLSAELVGKKLTLQDYKDILNGVFYINFSKFLNLNEAKLTEVLNFKHQIFEKYYSKSKLYEFCPKMILEFHKKNILMAIVSATNEDAIKKILNTYNLLDKFFFIAGMNKTGKVENIKKCIEISQIKNISEAIFITDTIGDIKDAKKADIKVAAVGWGVHNINDLKKENPDFIIDDPNKILEFLK
jgi:phosphoglycolate phosphatase-like HAD superfamily hydrolase